MDLIASMKISFTAFSAYELLYILETVSSSGSQDARFRLNIGLDASTANLQAGLTSLFVRGQVSVSSESVELADVAAAVGYVLTANSRWFEIANVSGDFRDAAWLVRHEALAIFVRPQPLNTFEVRLVGPNQAADWLSASSAEYLRGGDGRSVFLVDSSSSPQSGLAARSSRDTVTVEDQSGTLVFSGSIAEVDGRLSELFAHLILQDLILQ